MSDVVLPGAEPALVAKAEARLYDAFVSYSHAKDKALAAALQSAVQRLGKAWYQRRALRLFRDDTALTASPHLWPDIETALGRSRFLILLASPEAAASPWVDKEVATWLGRNPADSVLIALTAGDLAWDGAARDFAWNEETPLPPALKGRFPEEPRWIDVRPYREGARRRDARFADLAAEFAATLHGRPKDDLLSQEVRQQRRALRLAGSAMGLLLVLLGLAGWEWNAARLQRNRAEHNLALATETANGLVFDLAQKFRFSGIPAAVIADILNRARGLQDQLTAGGETSRALRYSEAGALDEIAYTLLMIGDTKSALAAAQKGTGILQKLVAEAPDDAQWQADLALSYSLIADALSAEGDLPGALAAYRNDLSVAKTVSEQHPNEPDLSLHLAIAQEKVGNILALEGSVREALAAYREDLRISAALVASHPEPEYQRNLAVSHEKIGDVLLAAGDGGGALAEYRTELSIIAPLAKAASNDTDRQRFLALVYDKIGDTMMALHKLGDALDAFRNSLAITRALADGDPGNGEWQRNLAVSEERVAGALQAQGKLDDALTAFREDLAIVAALSKKDPSNLQWQLDVALSYQHIGNVLIAQHQLSDALSAFRSQLAIIQHLVQQQPASGRWQLEIVQAYENVGDVLREQNDLPTALAAYRDSLAVATKIAANQPTASSLVMLGEINDRVASILDKQGDQAALAAYRESVDIARRLVKTEPDQSKWQLDLAFSLLRLADAGGDIKPSLTEALAILKRLDAAGKLTSDQKSWIATIETALTKG